MTIRMQKTLQTAVLLFAALTPPITIGVYAESTYAKKTEVLQVRLDGAQDRINVIKLIRTAYFARRQEIPPELEAELEYWQDLLDKTKGGPSS